jgi:Glu-tRNA(Gln) amidotransferase subunit E-like FAD-binding protein
MPREAVEKIVDEVLATMPDEKHMGKIMGRVMAAARGKADGKIVMEILKEKVS